MTCFAEERFVEILDQGGLNATRPDERTHLEGCDSCRESWAAVAAAGGIIAAARPKAAARGRLVPVFVAAAMLLTIMGVIAVRNIPSPVVKPVLDPLTQFLEGKDEESRSAREALLKGGKKGLPGLVAARPKLKGSARFQALQDLIFDIKLAAVRQDPEALGVFQKMEKMKIDLSFENTAMADILDFLRDFTSLNMVLDPTVDGGTVEVVSLKDVSLRGALEVICAVKGLDFDWRYGVIFISTPMRVWSTDPAAGLPAAGGFSRQVLSAPDSDLRDKLSTIRVTIDMQNAPMSAVAGYLGEICGFKYELAPAFRETAVTIKVTDLRLTQLLELLTLPRGWDALVKNGEVKIQAIR